MIRRGEKASQNTVNIQFYVRIVALEPNNKGENNDRQNAHTEPLAEMRNATRIGSDVRAYGSEMFKL